MTRQCTMSSVKAGGGTGARLWRASTTLGVLACAGLAIQYACARPARALSVPLRAKAKVLLWFRGRPVTVRSLTGVGYHQGLALARRAFRRWGRGPSASPGPPFGMLPSDGAWVKRGADPGKRLYLAGLSGVARRYLSYRLLRAFVARYRPNMAPYVDMQNLPRAATLESRLQDKYMSIVAAGIRGNWPLRRFLGALRRAFPFKPQPVAAWARFWHLARTNKAFVYTMANCFYGGPRGSRWERYDAYIDLGHIAIGVVVLRDPQKWIRLANSREGSWQFMSVVRATGARGELKAVAGVLRAVGSPSGNVHRDAMRRGNAVLRALGSRSRISALSAPFWMAAREAGLPGWRGATIVAFPLGVLVPARTWPSRLQPAYLCRIQTKVPKFLRGVALELVPGGPIFNGAQDTLLAPLARKLLASIRLMAGLRPLTAGELAGWNGNGLLVTELRGVSIPRVILRYPTTDPGWR